MSRNAVLRAGELAEQFGIGQEFGAKQRTADDSEEIEANESVQPPRMLVLA